LFCIGKALVVCRTDRGYRPLPIIEFPVVVPELELRQVAVQMFPADRMINTIESALNDLGGLMKIDLSKLSASELDDLLMDAAIQRSKTQPIIPLDPPAKIEQTVADPRYFIFLNPQDRTTVLRLRDPGRGWITFVFPPNERVLLLTLLLGHALAEPQAEVSNVPPASSGGGTLH